MPPKIDWTNLKIDEEWFAQCQQDLTDERKQRLVGLRGFPANHDINLTVTGGLGYDTTPPASWVIPMYNIHGDLKSAKRWRPTEDHRGWIHAGYAVAMSSQLKGPVGRVFDLAWITEHLEQALRTDRLPGDGFLWVTAGEFDCMMLRCYGWLATTHVHGENTAMHVPMLQREFGGDEIGTSWLSHLKGIIICLDVDATGQVASVKYVDAFEQLMHETKTDIPVRAIDLRKLRGWAEAGEPKGWDISDLMRWARTNKVKIGDSLVSLANSTGIGVDAARETFDVHEDISSKVTLNDTMRAAIHMVNLEDIINVSGMYALRLQSRAQGSYHAGVFARKRGWLFNEFLADNGVHLLWEKVNSLIQSDHDFTENDCHKQVMRGFLHIGGRENLTDDIANAIRLNHHFPFLKVNHKGNKKEPWLYWNGVQWRDGNAEVWDHAMRVPEYIAEEGNEVIGDDPVLGATLAKFAKNSRNMNRLQHMVTLAKNSSMFRLDTELGEDWDKDGLMLGGPSGVFDLEHGSLLTGHAARDKYCSMSTRGTILLDGAGEARWGNAWKMGNEFWDKTLREWQHGEDGDEVIQMLQDLSGMALRGQLDEYIIILQGSGRSGKSAFLDAIAHALGDYAYEVSGDVFVRGGVRGTGASGNMRDASKAQMDRKRMIKVTEVGGRQLDVDMLKQATGETSITGRQLYSNPSVATMHGTFFMMTNHELDLRGDVSEAMRGRVRIILFSSTFVDASRLSSGDEYRSGLLDGSVLASRSDLKSRLMGNAGEDSGFACMPDVILTWMYGGLVRVLKTGEPKMPASVMRRTSEMWASSDPLGSYWRESGLWIAGGRTSVTTRGLWNSVRSWAQQNGESDMLDMLKSTQQLGDMIKTMAARGYERSRTTKSLWSGGKQLEGWSVPYTYVGPPDDRTSGVSH